MIRNYLLFGAVVLVFGLLAVPASAQSDSVGNSTNETFDADQLLNLTENQSDIPQERAQQALDWYNASYEQIEPSRRGAVNLYLKRQAEETDTKTPTPEPSAESSENNSTANTPENISKDTVLQSARDGRNISQERAQQTYRWFNTNQDEFSSSEREIVQGWVTAQLSGQKTQPSQNNSTESRSFIFSDNQRYEQYNYSSERNDTYQSAIEAIKDGEIRENELADYYQSPQERVTPTIDLVYAEWEGDQTTLILRSEQSTTLSVNDAVLASDEFVRSAPPHTIELNGGLNVVQLPTIESPSRGIECVSFSTTDGVNTKCSGEPVNLISWFKSFISVGNVVLATVWGAINYYTIRSLRLKYRAYKRKSEVATRVV